MVLMQRLEYREVSEGLPAASLELAELLPEVSFGSPLCSEVARLETAKQGLQHSPFARCDRAVIDERSRAGGPMGRPEPLLLHQAVCGVVIGKAGYRRRVYVEIIKLAAARWRIGTDMLRLGGEQRMQRIDADDRSAILPRGAGERRKIAKVSDPPVVPATQTIELATQAPAARSRPELCWQIAPIRRDDQIDACRNVAGLELQTVIAERQTSRQRHRQAPSPCSLG